jgi:hypothetical protein
MKVRSVSALVFGALLTTSLLPVAQASDAGHIPNELTDKLLVEPLKKSESIWDVFQVLNGWLSEVYPRSGQGRDAINAFNIFIRKFNTPEARKLSAPRSVEMPLSVDGYLRFLRKNVPGIGKNPASPSLEGNVKAQIYTAALLPFLQMRGIAYRVRPLVSQSYVLHSGLINALRGIKQDLRVRTGTNGLAVFEYLTYPLADRKREVVQFTRFSELQGWVRDQLLPTLDVSAQLVEKALAEMKPGQKESIDLSVFLQADNPFPDDSMEMGHRTFSTAEVKQFLARIYVNKAKLHGFLAYNLDTLPAVSNKLRDVLLKAFFKEKIPFASLRSKPRVGSPSIVRYTVIKKFKKFLTLKDGSQGAKVLADLRKAWKYFDAAMNDFYSSPEGEEARSVNLTWLHATEKEYRNKIAPQITAALAGPASLTDYLGGAIVDLDIPGFLTSPPSDLKHFFPVKFLEKDPYWTFQFSSGKLAYTNYDFGTPVGWDSGTASDTWSKLFPTMNMRTNAQGNWEGPLVTFRDFSRTYLGRMIAPVLGRVVY